MIHILGSNENERCFSLLSFLKDKTHNHLNLKFAISCCYVCTKVLYTNNFPYDYL
jgi:hypothetical protein